MNFVVILTVPFFTAFIGWLTNKIAIKMLFRPQRAITIFGWSWQGLIPRRQAEIATRTADIIERELLGQHLLRNKIKNIDLRPYLRQLAEQLIRHGLGERIQSIPLLGGFINESHLTLLEKMVAEEITKEAPLLSAKLADEAERHLQIKPYIEEQIKAFDLDKLEEVISQVANKEFKAIALMGGLLGFLVGLLQLLLLGLTGNLNV